LVIESGAIPGEEPARVSQGKPESSVRYWPKADP
jgi:hypothetical protein